MGKPMGLWVQVCHRLGTGNRHDTHGFTCAIAYSEAKISKSNCPSTASEVEFMQNFPYQSLLSTLMYSMLRTCGDIAYGVGALSNVASNPGKVHWDEAVHVLCYLGHTHNYCLVLNCKKAGDEGLRRGFNGKTGIYII